MRTLRRLRIAGVAALASGAAWAAIGVPFLVLPAEDPLPARADVVVVLGPATAQRVALARRLFHEGVAGHMLWSVPPETYDAGTWQSRRFSACTTSTVVSCIVADPHTTQGEARALEDVARERGWRSAVVVTQTAHLVRARTILARCFTGRLYLRASGEPPEGGWPYQYAYQTAATAKAWLHPGC